MNNKMLVVVYSPLIDEEYDIFIPINKKVGTVKKIIIDSINYYDDSTSHVLINKEDNKVIDENVYVKESGIKNGARLILI